MILIALFLFIGLIVVALSMYNSSNLEEIKRHIQNEECKHIVYSNGSYKSLCENKILEISNSFNVNIEKNSKVYYFKDIKNVDVQSTNIILNDDIKLGFKNKEETYKFYDTLVKILHKQD